MKDRKDQTTHCTSFLARLKPDEQSYIMFKQSTYVHRAYRKPAKQKAAMSMRTTNCMIIALNDKTISIAAASQRDVL